MRIVSLGMQVTLDGFVAGPNGELDWAMERLDDELFAHQEVLQSGSDTMLLGRVNYLDQAAYWPTADEPLANVCAGCLDFARRQQPLEQRGHGRALKSSRRERVADAQPLQPRSVIRLIERHGHQ